jgi:hypothetical protein
VCLSTFVCLWLTQAYCKICQFVVHYESVKFYGTGSRIIWIECKQFSIEMQTFFAILSLPVPVGVSGLKTSTLEWWTSSMKGNQLPASAARWQHWSQICFATFNKWKITKLLITQQPLKLEQNTHRFGIHRNLMYVWPNLKTIKFYLIKLSTDF